MQESDAIKAIQEAGDMEISETIAKKLLESLKPNYEESLVNNIVEGIKTHSADIKTHLDGVYGKKTIDSVFYAAMGMNFKNWIPMDQMRIIFNTYDLNKDAQLDKEEYTGLLLSLSSGVTVASAQFDHADKDKSGFLERSEAMKVLKGKLFDDAAEEVFIQSDTSKDDKIDRLEFIKMCRDAFEEF